jgi:hypothetical protein
MIKVFGWIAFVLAWIGGSGLVGTGYATAVMVIATIGVAVVIAIDIAKDRKPDQYAIIGAFVLPSMISRINGSAAVHVQGWFTSLWSWAERNIGSWVGTTSVGLALFAVAISFIVSHKTMARGGR